MNTSWKAVLLYVAVAFAAFVAVMMYELYGLAIGLVLTTAIVGSMYAIGSAALPRRGASRHYPARRRRSSQHYSTQA